MNDELIKELKYDIVQLTNKEAMYAIIFNSPLTEAQVERLKELLLEIGFPQKCLILGDARLIDLTQAVIIGEKWAGTEKTVT